MNEGRDATTAALAPMAMLGLPTSRTMSGFVANGSARTRCVASSDGQQPRTRSLVGRDVWGRPLGSFGAALVDRAADARMTIVAGAENG
jgi:hypothetical protein